MEASMNTRLNIKNLDGNIIQKHGGSKQVPGVEIRVLGVHDKKRVWFEVFQVSNDDTAVAQRQLEDEQPEEKTNTDCLVKEQEKEYQTGWKIKTGSLGRGYNNVYISSEQDHHHQRLDLRSL
ncbi:hypothetical protein Tco_0208805, partial [Tanacetum coccineum]